MAYDHLAVEAHWQKFWAAEQIFKAERRPNRPKYYVLDMFPYPSGSGLHVGHPEGYTATDIVARYKRMRGFDVLHPMGWDAFGLPAEQYAIQTGTHPESTTKKNVKVFKRQLSSLGFSYDWDREINTTDAHYVRWTQWIFLQLFNKGLAFQSETPVNWCQDLGTVLANEEVIDGRSERDSFPVERRPLRQWQLKITEYADRLADELDGLDWPETRAKQRDWIGRSEGASVRFAIKGLENAELEAFTTRPDTLYGATYMVIAPDHQMTPQLASPDKEADVLEYIATTSKKSDLERQAAKEKSGVFTGSYALNPLTGEEIPIYTADYVLGAYGTGAIMAVPAHDVRDFEFAQAHGLPIVPVVARKSKKGKVQEPELPLKEALIVDGVAINSAIIDGLGTDDAKAKMIDHLVAQGIGEKKINYKLRDWVFSRQRYWGEPIPVYFPVTTEGDPREGAPHTIDYSRPQAVPESELPLKLPNLEDYRPGDPAGALVKALDWRFFQKDGEWFARETNTMPQWAGSCWYYLRYLDPKNTEEIFSAQAYEDWMPVDLYVGGAEHAVLHLLYARFWHKVLFDCGVVKHPEPFQRLVHQGMILGIVYRYYEAADGSVLPGDAKQVEADKEKGGFIDKVTSTPYEARFLVENEIELRDGKAYHPIKQVMVHPVAEKMSKARGNVVNPDDVVEEFGADTLRLYEMFMGPLEQVKPWQTSGLQGIRRFLDKVDTLTQRVSETAQLSEETEKLLHRTIKKVGEDIEAMRFNTAISAMMIYANHLIGFKLIPPESLRGLLLILAPFAPHLCESLYAKLGIERGIANGNGKEDSSNLASCISLACWPDYRQELCIDQEITLPVQVNGKVRARLQIDRTADEAAIRSIILEMKELAPYLDGKTLRKFIFVPGRICNLIVS